MSRFRKLLTVGLVLGLGLVLAWPFRKTDTQTTSMRGEDTRRRGEPAATVSTDAAAPHMVAKMASTTGNSAAGDSNSPTSGGASFDLANHPVLNKQVGVATNSPVTPTVRRRISPARDANLSLDGDEDSPAEVRHIVRNTDTLEKLAKRYLGDGGRALEIFDLNRDQLENPHLLPIGAELRIPADPRRMVD